MDEAFNKTFSQLRRDIIAGLAMVLMLVLFGILLLFGVAYYYSPSIVGVFNQAYTVLIISSQVATLGIQNAVLYYIPTVLGEKSKVSQTLSTSLSLVLISGFSFSAAVFLLSSPLAHFFSSPGLAIALKFLAPALIFLPANKILLNALNGLQFMVCYAVFSVTRIGLLLLFLTISIFLNISGEKLPFIFFLSECPLFFILVIFIHKKGYPLLTKIRKNNSSFLIKFGLKSMWIGMLHEVNTRVDIIMLSYFLVDKMVGIYSLPAVVMESILLASYSVRRNFDPIISRLSVFQKYEEFCRFIRTVIKYSFMGSATLGIIAIFSYQISLTHFPALSEYKDSELLLVILMAGGIFWSAIVPVSGIFIQIGQPGKQTFLIGTQVTINIVVNVICIPIFGLTGAAAATATTYIITTSMFLFLLYNSHPFKIERLHR